MKLADAEKVAEGVARLFQPFCERIEIAGSVRRRRPECGDVDLVVIPKYREHRNLLEEVERRENLLIANLIEYVRANAKSVRWKPIIRESGTRQGCEPRPDAKYFSIQGKHAQIDFFCATPENWATVLLTRTGSAAHNKWIAERAIARRAAFKPSEGILFLDPQPGSPGGMLEMARPKTEQEFYSLLGLPFIEPHLREVIHLMRIETESPCR